MAITDLTGTTWVWNNPTASTYPRGVTYSVNFLSNETSYSSLYVHGGSEIVKYDNTEVYEAYWVNNAYKTITITGGTDVTNADLISWLEADATQQGASQLTVDMSTLTGWASLSAGTHTLTIVAKATGYIDSDPSTGVQFMKGQRVDAPYIELGE